MKESPHQPPADDGTTGHSTPVHRIETSTVDDAEFQRRTNAEHVRMRAAKGLTTTVNVWKHDPRLTESEVKEQIVAFSRSDVETNILAAIMTLLMCTLAVLVPASLVGAGAALGILAGSAALIATFFGCRWVSGVRRMKAFTARHPEPAIRLVPKTAQNYYDRFTETAEALTSHPILDSIRENVEETRLVMQDLWHAAADLLAAESKDQQAQNAVLAEMARHTAEIAVLLTMAEEREALISKFADTAPNVEQVLAASSARRMNQSANGLATENAWLQEVIQGTTTTPIGGDTTP